MIPPSADFDERLREKGVTTPSDADHPHYAWGASGAKTWRACPGSINFANAKKAEGSIPADTSTAYSIEGTRHHPPQTNQTP